MLRLRTTTLPSKDLVSPSTSIATAASLPLRMIGACTSRLEADRHRLSDAQVLRMLRTCLDAKHQAGPLLAAIDDGGRELRLCRNKADARRLPCLAAVTVNF